MIVLADQPIGEIIRKQRLDVDMSLSMLSRVSEVGALLLLSLESGKQPEAPPAQCLTRIFRAVADEYHKPSNERGDEAGRAERLLAKEERVREATPVHDRQSPWLEACPPGELRRIEVGTLSRTRDRRSTCDAQREQLSRALGYVEVDSVDPPSFDDLLAEVARLLAAEESELDG